MGAMHPILFFAGVYVVVLLFSIFICSTIFYSCNVANASVTKKTQKVAPVTANTTASVAGLK